MTDETDLKDIIINGKTSLGIEFGSTTIKAVLIDLKHQVIASGEYIWENRFEDNIWTYRLEDIWNGLTLCYQILKNEVQQKYGIKLKKIGSIGISAMMHGYMVFDENDQLLVPYRTWRNTMTKEASSQLSDLFDYNIPQRWSIAHLYQAILNGEEHVNAISFQTTLAGYVHYKLTGEKVLGVGEASGMFPINLETKQFDVKLIDKFEHSIGQIGYSLKLLDIFPKVLTAGDTAGYLTKQGALLLDPHGDLEEGILLCPPEGDAGTGMVATNSVAKRTGNVSAGTSIFAMVVLEKQLTKRYEEIDLVTTPSGDLVGMVHCNNCTNEINSWVALFKELLSGLNVDISHDSLFKFLFEKAMEGDKDCGGLLSYNYLSGEHITGFSDGYLMFLRNANSHFNLANFMRVQLFSALSTLKIGMDILVKQEQVQVDCIYGHGGFFKTPKVGQRILAGAIYTPVALMNNAGVGGAWGIAVLASYCLHNKNNKTLEAYLNSQVYDGKEKVIINPDEEIVAGFETFINTYKKGLEVERAALHVLGGD